MGKSTLAAKIVRCLYEEHVIDKILGDSAKMQRVEPITGKVIPLEPGYYDLATFYNKLRHVQHYFTATKPAKSKGGLPYWRFSHTHTVWARILRNHLASKVHPLRTRSDCTLKRSTS
jgi:hypothetical protein